MLPSIATISEKDDDICIDLAELFFLDTETSEKDFIRVSEKLKQARWDRAKTYKILVELIAPVAGANLGYLFFPVIGEWAGFNKEKLCASIHLRAQRRSRRPSWWSSLPDRYCKWMLKELGVEKLLSIL